jgi:hypothetical protein
MVMRCKALLTNYITLGFDSHFNEYKNLTKFIELYCYIPSANYCSLVCHKMLENLLLSSVKNTTFTINPLQTNVTFFMLAITKMWITKQ